MPRPGTDVEETLAAHTDFVPPNKVRDISSSQYSASQIVEAQWASGDRNLERFITEQPRPTRSSAAPENDALPTTQRHGMGSLTYSPLTEGWLSGKYRKDTGSSHPHIRRAEAAPRSLRHDTPANQRKFDTVEQLAQLADESGLTLIELAIAFIIRYPASRRRPSVRAHDRTAQLPAVRGRRSLSTEVLNRIDEIVAPGSRSIPKTTATEPSSSPPIMDTPPLRNYPVFAVWLPRLAQEASRGSWIGAGE